MISNVSKKVPPLPVILFSCILSAFAAYATGNPLYSLVTGGKVLEERNITFQILIYSVVFLIVLAVLLGLFSRILGNLLIHPYPVLCVLAVIPLAAHTYVGSFSRFVADDFSSASLAVNKGIIGATWDWYVNWSGRFSASFFDSVAGYLPPSWMQFAVGGALILLLAAMTAFVYRILSGSARQKIYTGIFLSCLILTIAFVITPDLPQSLYWGQGMRSLILPLIPLFLQMFILADLYLSSIEKNRTLRLIILGLLSFFAGGFGETYVVIQTTLFGLFLLFVLIQNFIFHRQTALLPIFITLIFSIAAMAVTILAPGNHVRQAYFPPSPGIVELFLISFSSQGTFFQTMFQSGGNTGLLVFLMAGSFVNGCLYANQRNNSDKSSKNEKPRANTSFVNRTQPILITFLGFCILLFVCFIPAAYGMSTTPPGRTLILPTLILTAGISAIAFMAGTLVHPVRLPDGYKTMWLSLLVIIAAGFFSFQISSLTLRFVSDYRFFAKRFDRADQIIREAKLAGSVSVKVPEVHNHFGLSDYGEGTTYWLDNAVDTYYGVHVIINKNMK